MRGRSGVAIALGPTLLALTAAGCRGSEPKKNAAVEQSASAEAAVGIFSADAGPAGPGANASPSTPRPPRLRCRVIAVDGTATIEAKDGESSAALAGEAEVPEKAWVTLASASRFVAKDPRTARETIFIGPARARACVDRTEESWLSSGTFESVVGAGESPGAEEWVITPYAVVRYAAARVHVEVHATETRLTVASGVALLWPTHAKELSEGWQRLSEGQTATARTTGSALDATRSAVEQCAALARTSRDLAYVILNGTSDAALPDGAAAADEVKDQVRTRRLARAACGIAALRLDLSQASQDGGATVRVDGGPWGELAAKWADADAAWRTLPLAQGL
jgi:hypothetical protein